MKFIFVVDSNAYDQYEEDQTFRTSSTKRKEKKDIVRAHVSRCVLKVDLLEEARKLRFGSAQKRKRVPRSGVIRLLRGA